MWLRSLLFLILASAAALSFAGCGDDDYNGDAAAAGNFDLSASVDLAGADLTTPPTQDLLGTTTD